MPDFPAIARILRDQHITSPAALHAFFKREDAPAWPVLAPGVRTVPNPSGQGLVQEAPAGGAGRASATLSATTVGGGYTLADPGGEDLELDFDDLDSWVGGGSATAERGAEAS